MEPTEADCKNGDLGSDHSAQTFHELMSNQQLYMCFLTSAGKKGLTRKSDLKEIDRNILGHTLVVTQTKDLDAKLCFLDASNNG